MRHDVRRNLRRFRNGFDHRSTTDRIDLEVDLADVPTSRELVKTNLAFLEFAEMPFFIALPIAAPAGIPADRLKALQDGFMEMAGDQAFLDDATKIHFEVDPISGAAVVEAIAKAAKTPADVMAQFKALVSQ